MEWAPMQGLILRLIAGRGSQSNPEQGFLILDILFTLVVIGILVSQGWRSYLREVNRAKESEALLILRALNQGQIIHYVEQQRFSPSYLPGITKQSSNYNFSVRANTQSFAEAIATPKNSDLRGYISVICYDDQMLWVKTFQGLPNQLPVLPDISCVGAKGQTEVKESLADLAEAVKEESNPPPPETQQDTQTVEVVAEDNTPTAPENPVGDSTNPEDNTKVELVCEPNGTSSTKGLPGLAGKNPPGLAGKTPPGWEIAPGINKVVTTEGC
ncbi:MAG: type IV pilin-like G/H family protein [Synechococcus sp.]|nr:type IV pilin-like G/H family protein [Synechococcus sp.]